MTRLILARSSLSPIDGKSQLLRCRLTRAAWGLCEIGQKDREDGAVAFWRLAAPDTDPALVAGDDLTADPEPETCSGSSLGGVEGLEEGALGSGAHADAGVGDDDADSLGVGGGVDGRADAGDKAASAWHGVERVGDEVDEDLAELALIAEDGWSGGVVLLDDDVAGGEPADV